MVGLFFCLHVFTRRPQNADVIRAGALSLILGSDSCNFV